MYRSKKRDTFLSHSNGTMAISSYDNDSEEYPLDETDRAITWAAIHELDEWCEQFRGRHVVG